MVINLYIHYACFFSYFQRLGIFPLKSWTLNWATTTPKGIQMPGLNNFLGQQWEVLNWGRVHKKIRTLTSLINVFSSHWLIQWVVPLWSIKQRYKRQTHLSLTFIRNIRCCNYGVHRELLLQSLFKHVHMKQTEKAESPTLSQSCTVVCVYLNTGIIEG